MTFEWPRPCRYADLAQASQSGELPALALIADGEPQELAATISTWRSMVPSTKLSVFHTPSFAEAQQMTINTAPALKFIEVSSFATLKNSAEASACRIWASCAPYDAYGVLVKNLLESNIYDIIRNNHGVYMAHDPAYGVVRWFGANGLRDRLHYRKFRLLIYRWLCRAGLGSAWISSLVSPAVFRWRKIR
ncbi:MAG: hypothetical protein SH820_12170 [Xanthomonadales bacterium]|nr:hypothetical protein [Xanthomonadales bacterium]